MTESQLDIWPTVIAWGKGHTPSSQQQRQLVNWLQVSGQASVWQPASRPNQSLDKTLAARGALLQTFVQKLEDKSIALPLAGRWTDWINPLWRLWLPLAQRIDTEQRRLNKPFVQGILGGQGTGKSTLSQVLQLLLGCLGQQAVTLSIDDLYLTYAERRELQRQDPRLIWRGPPGTHDIALGVEVLSATCHRTEPVSLPQFDKSLFDGQGDRTAPLIVDSPTVVLFEGWFVGAVPLPASQLNADTFAFPTPIETPADRQFARDCNRSLNAYLPLWSFLHSLVVLKPKDYHWSLKWRQEAEYKMIAQGKTGLSAAEISAFVLYFWKALHPKLFIAPLTQPLSTQSLSRTEDFNNCINYRTSLVVDICIDHQVGSLYLPRDGYFEGV